MRQDMFDQVNRAKKGQGPQQRMGKAPPECPKKADKMTPFTTLAFTDGELYVRLDATEGPCHRLITVGGANLTELRNASLTCGPVGEWKKRLAEEMSMVFFQGGLEWPRNENETVEVITEDGTFQAEVNEAKYEIMMGCWKSSCGCEQANNPKMKILLLSLLVCALGGLSYDSVKLAYESLRGKKPEKHVVCKKGHKLVEGNHAYSHICDICRKSGTCYACTASCNYDMCKVCYKGAKKKARAAWKAWLEKHPEDPDNKKKDKDDDDDDSRKEKDDSQSEAGDKKESKSEAESDAPASEAEKDAATGDEKSEKSEQSEKQEKQEGES
jgi:hypothetical protein